MIVNWSAQGSAKFQEKAKSNASLAKMEKYQEEVDNYHTRLREALEKYTKKELETLQKTLEQKDKELIKARILELEIRKQKNILEQEKQRRAAFISRFGLQARMAPLQLESDQNEKVIDGLYGLFNKFYNTMRVLLKGKQIFPEGIYGDTDSVFVKMNSVDDGIIVSKLIEEFLIKKLESMGVKGTAISVKFEKFFNWCIFKQKEIRKEEKKETKNTFSSNTALNSSESELFPVNII